MYETFEKFMTDVANEDDSDITNRWNYPIRIAYADEKDITIDTSNECYLTELEKNTLQNVPNLIKEKGKDGDTFEIYKYNNQIFLIPCKESVVPIEIKFENDYDSSWEMEIYDLLR